MDPKNEAGRDEQHLFFLQFALFFKRIFLLFWTFNNVQIYTPSPPASSKNWSELSISIAHVISLFPLLLLAQGKILRQVDCYGSY